MVEARAAIGQVEGLHRLKLLISPLHLGDKTQQNNQKQSSNKVNSVILEMKLPISLLRIVLVLSLPF